MDERREAGEVNARIVYWGISGAGKLTNLQVIHAKLRPDHRGELREMPTPLDPTVGYAMLPIELGEVSGVRTRIQVLTVPSGAEQAPTRKQLLDGADGIVFVVDTRPERIEENLASFEELRAALDAYGRPLDRVPLVIQYNKRDCSDPFVLEELHRKLGMRGVAAFEAVASEGTAVLQTLTTISKRVIRHRREVSAQEAPLAPEAGPVAASAAPGMPEGTPEPAAPSPPPGTTQLLMQLEDSAPELEVAAPQPAPATAPLESSAPELDMDALGLETPLTEASSTLEPELIEAASESEDELAAVFDPAFPETAQPTAAQAAEEEVAGSDEAAPAASAALFAMKGLGMPALADSQTVTVPVRLRDPDGRERHLTLRLRIEAVEDGSA
jgi:signal recognition particle receptor subunit beta